MTTMVIEQEVVDLSDLEALDEIGRHWCCLHCFPGTTKALEPFIALCGTTALASGQMSSIVHPDDCQACVDLIGAPCRRCGE